HRHAEIGRNRAQRYDLDPAGFRKVRRALLIGNRDLAIDIRCGVKRLGNGFVFRTCRRDDVKVAKHRAAIDGNIENPSSGTAKSKFGEVKTYLIGSASCQTRNQIREHTPALSLIDSLRGRVRHAAGVDRIRVGRRAPAIEELVCDKTPRPAPSRVNLNRIRVCSYNQGRASHSARGAGGSSDGNRIVTEW